jgi:DNA-binding transcriptional ArsR family regulator
MHDEEGKPFVGDEAERQAEQERLFIEAIQVPIRAGILAVLNDRVAGAREIATEIGEPIAKVRYHLRALRSAGLIDTESRAARRGAAEQYFALSSRQWVDEERFKSLSGRLRRLVANYNLRLIVSDISRVVRSGSTHDERVPTTVRFRLDLDEQGWDELIAIHVEAAGRIEGLKHEAAERLRRGDQPSLPVTTTLTALELPPGSSGDVPFSRGLG